MRKLFKALPFGWMGGGAMILISAAYTVCTYFYPLTKYDFISQDIARGIFWFFVVLGILGLLFVVMAIVRFLNRNDKGEVKETENDKRIGIRMKGGKGNFDKTKIRGMDDAVITENTDLKMKDTDIS
jgi:hypothetical protein